MFLTVLLGFLKFLFELTHFLRQISHLAGVSAACFIPELFLVESKLNQPVLTRAADLLEPATLRSIVGREWSVRRLAPLAILDRTALLGGPSIRTSPMSALLGHAQLSRFSGCCNLGLLGPGFLVVYFDEQFLDVLKVH